MDTVKRKLKLEESIAGVHLADCGVGAQVTGVAEVIPAGEIVQVDRQAPVVGRLRQIEWNGSRYGVFPDDLLERTDKPNAS
jgi:hypothetical protein